MQNIDFESSMSADVIGKKKGELIKSNVYIEYVRIIAAFGIVWFHSGVAGFQIAYSGLAAFIIITFFLETNRAPSRSLQINVLATRLILPWLFWMALFAIYNVLRHKPALQPTGNLATSVLYGSAPHLWYLPFVFALQTGYRAVRQAGGTRQVGYLCAFAVPLGFIFVNYWRPETITLGSPIAQYAQAILGVGFGILCSLAVQDRRWSLALLVSVAATFTAFRVPGIGLPYLVALMCVAPAIIFGARADLKIANPSAISQLMYGVYLIHLPLIGLLKSEIHGPYLVTLVFLIACIVVWGMRRFGGIIGLTITGGGKN